MGVASSLWSVIFQGNVELSIIMNVINTLLSCGELKICLHFLRLFFSLLFVIKSIGTTPFWLFTLGTTILDSEQIKVPYNLIAQYICFSFIPLLIGILIQYMFPNVAEISKPILVGIAFPFLIFIIVVSILRGFHVFSMTLDDAKNVRTENLMKSKRHYKYQFVFQFIFAGLCLSNLGYSMGWFFSRAFKLQKEDSLTVALSTVNIHSVIAITLFKFFARPQKELAALFPISAIILSPIPISIHFMYNKFSANKL